jgi:pimeloyl-ACP methyl ester carboxylesterase
MPHAVNGAVRIYYETVGDGPPLLLHTGFGGVVETWAEFGYVDALRADYRLILLDLRGQGRSDKPHDPAAYALDTRVGDVVAVLDAAGAATAHFWGYSEGGRMGVATARYAPQRLRSLVLGGPAAAPVDPEDHRRAAASLRAAGAAGEVAFWEQELGGGLSERLRARLLATDVEALAANQLYYAEAVPDLRGGLADIRVPTLVYCSPTDGWYAAARALAAAIPAARFVTTEALTHAQAYARSDAVVPQVRAFLAGVEGRRGAGA